MGTVLSIVNQRDGVGKTTTAVNLASCLALFEKKVLLVDCDPQGDASACMAIEDCDVQTEKTLYQALSGNVAPDDLIRDAALDYLRIIPAHIDLFQVEHQFSGTSGRERRLQDLLNRLRTAYDYILVDTPSSLGFLTNAAMIAADSLIIPVECRDGAVQNLGYLLKTVTSIRRNANPGMKIAGIVFTKCDSDEEIYHHFPAPSFESIRDIVFSTTIGRSSRLQQAAPRQQGVVLDDIMADVSADYLDLAAGLVNV
ncbi:MAG: AAA family ATPase [Thermodesulfobacteriota bacterium]|nr:AAA family ATPase [Thermodesulfobacteriota bacterium]